MGSVGGERVSCTRCEGRREGEWRARGVEPRGLINETYAAAADTEMHCKYSIPKKLLSPDEIYTCPNYTRVEASEFFFRPSNNSLSALFFASMPARLTFGVGRYSYIYMGQQIRQINGARMNRKVHPHAHEFAHRTAHITTELLHLIARGRN